MPSDQLVEDLLFLWRLLRQSTHPAYRGEITLEQYWLLRILRRTAEDGLSIGELAARTGVGQSSITTACKRLEKAGLVSRRRDARDERVVRVSLTAEGVEQVEQWRHAKRAALTQLLEPLTAGERRTLEQLMRRVVELGSDDAVIGWSFQPVETQETGDR
ncbi:MAG TPA: MarR family transcriptional regulator [Thermomicrobiales bacterium]|nr:MarR family transcriptional regulator [Thermomicrobiales bacterium]